MSSGLVFSILILLILFIFQTIIIFRIFYSFISNGKKRKILEEYFKENIVSIKKKYERVPGDKFILFDVEDIPSFRDMLFDKFILFENAYNSLDYEMMKACCSKELFDKYYTSIILNLNIGRKRILTNIEKERLFIYDLRRSKTEQVVSAIIDIRYTNYTINKVGAVIGGSRIPVKERFEVVFKKNLNDVEANCPNCGAPVIDNRCDFCKTDVISHEGDFVIDSIKRIID